MQARRDKQGDREYKVEVSAAEFLSASARGGRRDEPSRKMSK
jgi:hypothetical protein